MSITEEILEMIKELGELLPGFLESPYQHSRILKRSTYYGSLARLQKQGLVVKKYKADNKFSYIPTRKAFKKSKFVLQKRTDGLLTIVIFDIPENRHTQRNYFRRHLITHDFKPVQKSVFISYNELDAELRQLIVDLKIENFVTTIEGKIQKEI